MKKHPIIIGDSHVIHMSNAFGSVGSADDIWLSDGVVFPFQISNNKKLIAELIPLAPRVRFFCEKNNVLSINKYYEEIILEKCVDWNYLLISLEGNLHNIYFFLEGTHPFDFFHEKLPTQFVWGRQVVRYEDLFIFFKNLLMGADIKIKLLKNILPSMPFYFVAPPPPIPSEDHIKRFPEVFDFVSNKLNNSFVRLKIYLVYLDVLSDFCLNNDIKIVLPPPDCIDSFGFLLEKFWNHATHAQPSYYNYIVMEKFLNQV